MTALISLISISCLVVLAFLFNRLLSYVETRLSNVEERLKLTQDGELRRMLAKANETIANLRKENRQLKLSFDIKEMNDSLEKTNFSTV